MGIPGLETFIDKSFTEWRCEAVRGKLVIDGNQLCHQLYHSNFNWPWRGNLWWVYGGQYPEYRAAVEKFFEYLQRAGITPIVVLDGFLHMEKFFERVYNRYKERAAHRHKALLEMPGSPPRDRAARTLPPMAYQVFHATLLVRGVQQIIADGEGDAMVIRVANEYNCPVLSQDSDFFIAHLPKGYIPLDQFNKGLFGNPTLIKADVFHLREFNRQFGLQAGNDLHLAIPAVMGNDYLKNLVLPHLAIDAECFFSIENCSHLIEYLKRFESFEAFLASIPPASSQDTPEKHTHSDSAHEKQTPSDDTREKRGDGDDRCEGEANKGDDTQAIGEDIHQKLRSNYQQAVEMYNSVEKCTPNALSANADIPQWLAEKYYCGKLNSCYLLQAWLLGYQLPQSSETSKLLRQYAYSILGVGAKLVCEYPVTRGTVSEVRVEAVHSIQGSPPQRLPRISEVEGLSPACRKQLLYQMLACDHKKIETLEEKWRLVIASVVFWAKETQPNQALVKALLVCFLLCYEPPKWLRLEDHGADSWLETQSAFIAWQCTYLDSIGLNEMLMEPLQSPSAASLFDGKLAMGLAAEPNVDDRVTEFGINLDLYQSLLSAVLPQYEALAAWKSVNSEPKSKARPGSHSRRAGPEPHSRRAGPEPHSRRAGPEPHRAGMRHTAAEPDQSHTAAEPGQSHTGPGTRHTAAEPGESHTQPEARYSQSQASKNRSQSHKPKL